MTEEEELEELKKALDKKQIEFNIGTDENLNGFTGKILVLIVRLKIIGLKRRLNDTCRTHIEITDTLT